MNVPVAARKRSRVICLALMLVLCGRAVAADVTAYVGATLIDGTGRAPVENATVLVQDDRVLFAGDDVGVLEGARTVDVSGRWIVPGLIDSHIHFMTSGRAYTRPAFIDLTDKVPYSEEIAWIKAHLPETLHAFMCSGVTSVLSLGGPSLEYDARELARRMDDAPTVFIGHGVIAHAPRFVAERAIPPWDGELTIKPVVSPEEAVAAVEEAVDRDADLIKTAMDDRGSLVNRSLLWWYDWRELERTVIEAAARHGLRVTTHAHALEYARGMIELGVASLQHVPADQPVDEAFIELAKEKGVIVVPTLGLRERTFVELYTKEIDLLPIEEVCSVPGVVDSWYEPFPAADGQSDRYRVQGAMAAANTKTLFDAGVTIAAATDAGMIGLAAGSSMHLELRALNQAGIPAEDLIRSATLNSAAVAGKDDEYGSVEPGKFADFLILSADPIADIANLQRIEQVVKHGRAFSQGALLPSAR